MYYEQFKFERLYRIIACQYVNRFFRDHWRCSSVLKEGAADGGGGGQIRFVFR